MKAEVIVHTCVFIRPGHAVMTFSVQRVLFAGSLDSISLVPSPHFHSEPWQTLHAVLMSSTSPDVLVSAIDLAPLAGPR